MNHRIALIAGIALASSLTSSSSARASGFEKSALWSGRYSGIGNAASSSVAGSESLYFNPAGLASGLTSADVSLNFSPTFAKFSGPVNAAGTTLDGSRVFLPVFGATAAYRLTEKWGFGLGTYVSGGTKSVFEGVSFGNIGANTTPSVADVKADLQILEFAAGTGYEVIDGLRVGLSYRVVHVNASLSSAAPQASAASPFSSLAVDGLSATRYNGFKVGVQYGTRDSAWGVGADWRTEIGFVASTDTAVTGTITSPAGGGQQSFTGTGATVANVFPQQFNIGGHYRFLDHHRAFLQYTFTEYAKNRSLDFTGSFTLPTSAFLGASSGATSRIPSIPQNWINQSVLRVGYECAAPESWALRAGYIFASQTTPVGDARATFTPPAGAHVFSLGTGKMLMDQFLEVNGAAEYTISSGETPAGTPGSALAGEYKVNAYAFHLGTTLHL